MEDASDLLCLYLLRNQAVEFVLIILTGVAVECWVAFEAASVAVALVSLYRLNKVAVAAATIVIAVFVVVFAVAGRTDDHGLDYRSVHPFSQVSLRLLRICKISQQSINMCLQVNDYERGMNINKQASS